MIRITLNGAMCQLSSKLSVEQSQWDSKTGKVRGRNAESVKLNALLDNIRCSLINHFQSIEQKDGYATPEKIRDAFLGKQISQETILQVFKKYNERLNELKNANHKSPKTVEKYERSCKRIEAFLLDKRHLKDIPLREINYDFIIEFENYLLVDCKYGHNTASKYMQYFRSVFLTAKNNGLVTADPFHNHKITFRKVDLGYLEEEELQILMEKSFSIKRLEQVRDLFIFSCWTGLAFIDVMNLTKDNIRKSFDDNMWIITKRRKTDVKVNVPILTIPQKILEKYEGTLPENTVLPKISNQKMNAYLKEIADLCGIKKNLTTHVARHTFATTTTLTKGVPIETVSKMLGHTKLSTTQIYARITERKISNDMNVLSQKLNGIEKQYKYNT
jgi:site-specific recombinase XerD